MTNTKFVAGTVVTNGDVDILVADIRDGMLKYEVIMDEAFEHQDTVVVVDDNLDLAQATADTLNEEYTNEAKLRGVEEMTTQEQAKELVSKVFEVAATTEEEHDPAAAIAATPAAQEFLNKFSAKMANAKVAPSKKQEAGPAETEYREAQSKTLRQRYEEAITKEEATKTKEEVKMNTTTTNTEVKTTTRRRLGSAAGQTQNNTNKQEEMKEMNNTQTKGASRRLSAGATAGNTNTTSTGGGRRRLQRSESATRSNFVQHEGPWYLNASLYPVLERFESILETMSDDELGIQDIRLVEATEFPRYAKQADVLFVVQLLTNGVVLNFPITQASASSKADLSSKAIGWINTRNGVRPAFGHWRGNSLKVEAKCACGKEFEAETTNMYCRHCRKRHEDVVITGNHNLEFGFVDGAIFETNPHMSVPRDVLALVMAIAQYDEGYDMHGVVAE